ncbi:hypothetical protein EcMakalu001_260 [Escherichia phage Ec_Makalu_001]|uniref:Uncharacterized protein n=1 Tax=Escherichia phage Ec_Makalu_001 TaxID=2704943 RepID=A0A6B9SRQ7_9CAUD|nr:hypothetical protein EcMakalu001_260 [Escherichia phage Ec_Makalu_001]
MKSIEQVVTEFMSYEGNRIFGRSQVREIVEEVAEAFAESGHIITKERKEEAVNQIMAMQKMRINLRVGKN